MNCPQLRLIVGTLFVWFSFGGFGCMSIDDRGEFAFPDHRPSDFTLGIVVYGREDAVDECALSARYIIDSAGNLRVSVGNGSDAQTYPKITRRLNEVQLDQVWDLVNDLALIPNRSGSNGRGYWTRVDSVELFTRSDFTQVQYEGYLLEIRLNGVSYAWESMIDLGSPTSLVQLLAEFAWIRD